MLFPRAPAEYFFPEEFLQKHFPRRPGWSKWRWANFFEIWDLLDKIHPCAWDSYEILRRFGYEANVAHYAPYKRGLPLLKWDSEPPHYSLVIYREDLIPEIRKWSGPVAVPLHWVKEVLWSAYNCCVQVKIVNGFPVAYDEDNLPRISWPGAT